MADDVRNEMSFEQALAELETVVQQLESGALALEETVTLYERGRQLAQLCQSLLDAVDLRLQQLVPDGAGGFTAAPLVLKE